MPKTLIILLLLCLENLETNSLKDEFDSSENEHSAKPFQAGWNEPETDISTALDFLIDYYETAQDLEKRLHKLQDYEIYSDKVDRANEQGVFVLEKLGKLSDKLEALMIEGRQGKLPLASYKQQLFDMDSERKKVARESGMFEANITSVKPANLEFDDLIDYMRREFSAYVDAGKGDFSEYVAAVDPPITLIDPSVTGYKEGESIDFDLKILKDLFEKYEHLNELKDELSQSKRNQNAKDINRLTKAVNDYESKTIETFIASNKKMLGRFLPSIGGITVRIGNKRDEVEKLKSEWDAHIDWAEKLYFQITAAEERFSKVVKETAIVLKEMMKDEL